MLLAATLTAAILYFLILSFWLPQGNAWLFALLIAGEIFHLWQAITYLYTVWDTSYSAKVDKNFQPWVDIYITVAGEPVEVVETTARAAMAQRYPNFRVYLLNDGLVAKKDNWQQIERLAQRLGIECITREKPGGAKAGNINNALNITASPLVAIFDADQVPHKNFLSKTVGYFGDTSIGFVQTPQYYKNKGLNEITAGSWEQQEIFFGPICKGKNRLNSTFLCGTNMVIRKTALLAVGGMCEDNIAEDFLTSLFIHEQGWKSVYVPKILTEGLAPQDFLSYYKQQFRWSRGSLEVVFKYNPLFRKGLSLAQRVQYLASASYYLSGLVVLVNALMPLVFFYTGLTPLNTSTMNLAAVFLPYIFLTILVLRLSSRQSYTFRALAFSMSSFPIQIWATLSILLGRKANFSVTSKKQLKGDFWYLAAPHLAYVLLALLGIELAILRQGLTAAVLTNISWALFNISVFLPFIQAAVSPQPQKETQKAAVGEISPAAEASLPERSLP